MDLGSMRVLALISVIHTVTHSVVAVATIHFAIAFLDSTAQIVIKSALVAVLLRAMRMESAIRLRDAASATAVTLAMTALMYALVVKRTRAVSKAFVKRTGLACVILVIEEWERLLIALCLFQS